MCHHKINPKAQKYQPTLEMVDILLTMARIMRDDPKKRGYVLMVERPEKASLKKDEKWRIATNVGIKQNHKMRLLGLISYVGPDGPCGGSSKRIQAAYTITQKGEWLLMGISVGPWQIHVKNKRIVKMAEDEQTKGNLQDIRDYSYDEYKEQMEDVRAYLKLPR